MTKKTAVPETDDPTKRGGVYVDGKRVEGPEPDEGWVIKNGERVPARKVTDG